MRSWKPKSCHEERTRDLTSRRGLDRVGASPKLVQKGYALASLLCGSQLRGGERRQTYVTNSIACGP